MRAKDSYSNALAKLGAGQPNLLNAAEYPLVRLSRDYRLMTSLYRNDWICKRIIDTPAEDMTRRGIHFVTSRPSQAVERLEKAMASARVMEKIKTAVKWARLYGGAGAVMMIRGQERCMDQPLDVSLVLPGAFCGLMALDRWEGIRPGGSFVKDMRDGEFGLPEYYLIGGSNLGGAEMRVHHSRVLRFTGRELPAAEAAAEDWWGAGEMEHIYDELNKRNTSSANIAQLLFQANLRVLKTGDMAEQMATMDPEALKEIYQVAQAQNELMSSFGLQFLDRDDSFETHSYTFGGIADVYKVFMSDIAGAAEIPATKLFGRSPEGMNATGESDLTNYYDSIAAKQESLLRPALEKLLPVLMMSAWGCVVPDVTFAFNPIRTLAESEQATIAKCRVETVLGAYGAGLISREQAVRELGRLAGETGLFVGLEKAAAYGLSGEQACNITDPN